MDEGYIKYKSVFTNADISISESILKDINQVRTKLVDLNMIGKIPNGPGFGNISVRTTNNEFLISGTNTGHLKSLTVNSIACVSKINIEQNCVWNHGKIQASSESMSHGVIYMYEPNVNAIIHIHHASLWKKCINNIPTTSKEVTYGTPDMATEIINIIGTQPNSKIIVLGGHTDGLISFGKNLQEALTHILNLFKEITQKNR